MSGIGAVSLLCEMGANPVLYDENKDIQPEELKRKLIEGNKAECYTGILLEEVVKSIELVVLSPGVSVDSELATRFAERNIPIIGEIELGFLQEKGRMVAITGTNGKTTTTTLVGEILKAYFTKVFVVGNIGNPYTLEVLRTTEDSVTVGEISSFQLETVRSFRPTVSAILNVTPDHMNRHHTMEAYVATKEAIAMNQTKEDICVLNYENPYTLEFGERCPASVVWFSSLKQLEEGYFLLDEEICFAQKGKVEKLLHIHKDMNLVGICNVENVMAAIAIARGIGVPMETVLEVIRTFKAVEHRIEYVATKKGVDYYNDSKATNPDAAIQGIRAMNRPTILIGGGYDKQNQYDAWIEAFEGKVKLLVLIGQTKEEIANCARKHGFEQMELADSFEEAFGICVKAARDGDAVLLSPACASWGMFPNYEERGRIFKQYVNELKE